MGGCLIICYLSFYQKFKMQIDCFLFLNILSSNDRIRNKIEYRMSIRNLVNTGTRKLIVENIFIVSNKNLSFDRSFNINIDRMMLNF